MNKKPDWWIGSLTIIYGIYMFTVGLKTANQYNGAILVIGGMIVAAFGVSYLAFLDTDVVTEPTEEDEDNCLECLNRPTYVRVIDNLPYSISMDYYCEKHKVDGAVKIDYLEELSGDFYCPNCGMPMWCCCESCEGWRKESGEDKETLPWVVFDGDQIGCAHCGMKHHIDWWEQLAVDCVFSEKQ